MPLDLQPTTDNVDYQIICRASREAIDEEIRQQIEAGWQRCGSIGGSTGGYYQAMVKFLH